MQAPLIFEKFRDKLNSEADEDFNALTDIVINRCQKIFEEWLEGQVVVYRISCPVWIEEKDLDLEQRVVKARLVCLEKI